MGGDRGRAVIALGAGAFQVARATAPAGASAFVPIAPCRLTDTRPGDDNVGGRTTPVGPADTLTLDGWGARGQCTGPAALPTGTTGLQLNVTAVGATAATYLTLFPGGSARPTASNLNPAPGQPPVPNAVTVALSNDGQFSVYNAFGSVDVIVDVVGYYLDHHHDDRYYTTAQSDAAITAALAGQPNVYAAYMTDGALDPEQTTPGVVSAVKTGTGAYTITLDRDAEGCVVVANIFGGPTYYVYSYVAPDGTVGFSTYEGTTAADAIVSVVIVCAP
jgi:hypothetical protein